MAMGRGEASRDYIMEDRRVTSLYTDWFPSELGSVVEVAVGGGHRLALKSDGTVVEWGDRSVDQGEVPDGLSDVVAVATGKHGHCLALRIDGTVVAWGDNSYGQCNVPKELDNAVAIAAGWRHSLALRADGKVVIWGDKYKWHGHHDVPVGLDNVVAIAAEYNHNLALKADGTVVAWGGENKYGECDVPEGLAGVVAIAAGRYRSLALKADGTVAAWGWNDAGQCDFAAAQTGVVAMVCRAVHSRDSFLVSLTTPTIENTKPLSGMTTEAVEGFARSWRIADRPVVDRMRGLCAHVVSEFDFDFNDSLNQLTGAKVLLESVLALGLPDSLDQDDVLRGFLFGSESLIDREGERALFEAEQARLDTAWRLRASTLEETPWVRLECFRRRLYERLDALEQSGTPEIARMVGHTLLLLRLLRAAH
jgi:hypothetical protein